MTHNATEGECAKCGGKVENGRSRICYGCHLDSLIPAGYQIREQYVFDKAWRKLNATKSPRTGVDLLDLTPIRLCDMVLPKGLQLPR